MTRLRPWLVLAALLSFAGSAHAQQPTPTPAASLGIQAPPRGPLSREQLQAVAKDIHALEANPLASDAAEARRALLAWVADSPDVTVKVCSVVEPLTQSASSYHGQLLLQFILSSAAHVIEHPDQSRDVARVTAGGFEGVLATYTALKAQQGERATDAFMERLSDIRDRGGLEEFAREGTKECD